MLKRCILPSLVTAHSPDARLEEGRALVRGLDRVEEGAGDDEAEGEAGDRRADEELRLLLGRERRDAMVVETGVSAAHLQLASVRYVRTTGGCPGLMALGEFESL